MTLAEAIRITVCCQYDGGLPGEQSSLPEARRVLVETLGDRGIKCSTCGIRREPQLVEVRILCQECACGN